MGIRAFTGDHGHLHLRQPGDQLAGAGDHRRHAIADREPCLRAVHPRLPQPVRRLIRGEPPGVHHPGLQRPVVPKTVEVRYRVEGGRRDRKAMNRLGEADPERDEFQTYSYTFQGILTPIDFELVGNDAYPYSTTLSPSLVFNNVDFSGA